MREYFRFVHDVDASNLDSKSSRFFSDLHTFDLEHRRWFEMPMRVLKDKGSRRRAKTKPGDASDVSSLSGPASEGDLDLDLDPAAGDDHDDDQTNGTRASGGDWHGDDAEEWEGSDAFGYIDADGKLVYVREEPENAEESEEAVGAGGTEDTGERDTANPARTSASESPHWWLSALGYDRLVNPEPY